MEEKEKLLKDVKTSEDAASNLKMANIVGHEIRNMLANLTNASYLIRQELTRPVHPDSPSKAPKYLDIIDRAIKGIDGVVQNMMDYSRTRTPSFSSVDIYDVMIKAVRELVVPQSCVIETSNEVVPQITVDEEEIKNVLKNILKNAIESCQEKEAGKIGIQISHSQNELRIEISDNGCGIEPANFGRIYEPFFSTKSKGTGLGLTVAKRLVEERHRGKLEVSSVPGQGTKVYITLPAVKNEGK